MTDGRCSHRGSEEIRTYGGDVIAHRCASCTGILSHVGKCDGCEHIGRLAIFGGTSKRRFCTDACKKAAATARRAAKVAAAKEARK